MGTIIGFVFLGAAVAIMVAVASKNRALAGPLLVGLILRAGLAVVDANVLRIPGQSDSEVFDMIGWFWSRNGALGTFDHITTGAHLYTWLVSLLYAIFDRSRMMMQAINVLFGSLIILNVARLTALLARDERLARRAAWLTALFPSLMMYSAVMMREVAVTYPLSLGVLYLARWYNERKNTQMIGAVIALLISMAFHSGGFAVFMVLGVWLLGSWVRSIRRGDFRFFGRNTLALIAGALAVTFVLSSGFGMDKFRLVSEAGVEGLSQTQTNFAHGRAAYLQELRPESRADLTWQLPIRLIYFFFAPFPWMLETTADLVGLVDSALFALLFWWLWKDRKRIARRPDALLVLAVFGTLAITFAAGVSNYGTAYRHRNKMLPLLLGAACAFPRRRRGLAESSIPSTIPAPAPLAVARSSARPAPAARVPTFSDRA